MLLSLVYFVKSSSLKRSYCKFCRNCAMKGDVYVIQKLESCARQINDARDRENILHFEHFLNKV